MMSGASILNFSRDKELRQREVEHAFLWQLFRAFMSRRVRMFRTLSTVSIVFDSETDAQEFERQILQKAARK